MKPLLKKQQLGYELTKCLGWCGKQFLSPDKTRIRFCRACTSKKDHAERSLAKIRTFGDGLALSD